MEAWCLALSSILVAVSASAEIVHLHNGDAIHGMLVAANNTEVTLKTAYGQLVIPKKDIARIEYEDGSGAPGSPPKAPAPGPATAPDVPAPRKPTERPSIQLEIRGRSFWYAFDAPPGLSVDPAIRLHFSIGENRACTFADEKPDTVDGTALYNSFTFSPTDSRLVEALQGYECRVEKAQDGTVVVRLILPPGTPRQVASIGMLYEVNEGTGTVPNWTPAVERSFSIEVSPGRVAHAVLEQRADALEFSGFFKKKMKNVEKFEMSLISTELRD
jgi:hypothetical protein